MLLEMAPGFRFMKECAIDSILHKNKPWIMRRSSTTMRARFTIIISNTTLGWLKRRSANDGIDIIRHELCDSLYFYNFKTTLKLGNKKYLLISDAFSNNRQQRTILVVCNQIIICCAMCPYLNALLQLYMRYTVIIPIIDNTHGADLVVICKYCLFGCMNQYEYTSIERN